MTHSIKPNTDPIDFFIISGTSGSGKTIALQVLEDLSFYCIDNLPASLMPDLAAKVLASPSENKNCAISIDSRNSDFIGALKSNFDSLKQLNINYKIIFLDADDNTLLTRFSETRRKHPLSSKSTSLLEAIQKERVLLEHILEIAHQKVDTSLKTPHELRSIIRNFATTTEGNSLTLLLKSFGFKYGSPRDVDFMFDVRCLPNPHWEKELKPLTGLDAPVIDFLSAHAECNDMFEQIQSFIEHWLPYFINNNRSYITVGIGCTGGQHRSVYLTERLNSYFTALPSIQTQVRHKELNL